MYSPKIKEEFIPIRYRLSKKAGLPMTTYSSRNRKGGSMEYTSKDLQILLSGLRIRLDCGHRCTVGHNFANTLIIVSLGGGRVETWCHSCY